MPMFSVTGQTTALTTTNNSALVLRPNQMIAMGSMATDGSGFSIPVSSSTRSSAKVLTRASTVNSRPSTTPISRLSSSSHTVAPVARARSPEVQPARSARPTSAGAGKISGSTSDQVM